MNVAEFVIEDDEARKREVAHEAGQPKAVEFKSGSASYVFGGVCFKEYTKGSGEDAETVRKPFARNVWPTHVYRQVEDQEVGVLFEYVPKEAAFGHKRRQRGAMSADAFVSRSQGRKVVAEQAKLGVDIVASSGHLLAEALGRWADHVSKRKDKPTAMLVRTPGWHDGGVYINGTEVFGADDVDWYADDQCKQIRDRSTRAGTLEEWVSIVSEYASTPALRAALGVSLAGPLIELLNHQQFVLHIHGPSSSGKSTAARLAASVWGSEDAILQTWNTTVNGFELVAEAANGGCLVLDEMGQFRSSDRNFAGVVYDLCSHQGRIRATRTGGRQDQRSWRLTAVSTGEISLRDKAGQYLKGGQMVRMLDLSVQVGEVTLDAAHAKTLHRLLFGNAAVGGHYGLAGDHWISYLLDIDAERLEQTRQAIRSQLEAYDVDNAESGRILDNICVIGVALHHAREAGLIRWEELGDLEAVEWLAQRVLGDRSAMQTPEERALSKWLALIDTEPSRFPVEDQEQRTTGKIYGYTSYTQDKRKRIWTCESMVKESPIDEVSPRSWLTWCVDNGYCDDREDRPRVAGKQRRWKVFDPSGLEARADDEADAADQGEQPGAFLF